MATMDEVSRIAADLPGSVEKPSGGGLAWFVRNKPFAWELVPWPSLAPHVRELVATEICIGVRLADEDDKRALLDGWPTTFVANETPWMNPKIIVRLAAIDRVHLAELVIESWRTQAPKYLINEFEAR